mmetsp:Transcript_21896/g.48934  ORF Transcript_21896/g.48934 Transcript_21896/m.48934 type:complete len:469 (+) Transcript_21896:355-1761(+)
MPTFLTRRARRRRGGIDRQTSSARRLSSIVNPDVLHDVAWHTMEEFSRQAPARRHSIAGIHGGLLTTLPRRPRSQRVSRAASDKVGISKSDAAALLEQWRQNERGEEYKELGLGRVPEDEEDFFDDDENELSSSKSSSSWSVGILATGLFLGYILSSAGLQKLNSLRPGCGQLVTLLQYLATIGEKSPHARTYIYSPVLPIRWHALFVVLMFLSVQMANASLGAGLPFALFLVIKNTNLVFSLLFGLIFGRSFTTSQIMNIVVITTGIVVCVVAQNQTDGDSGVTDTIEPKESVTVLGENATVKNGIVLGAALATASTACMALLGAIQETIFARYKDEAGQESGESLFFTHLLGLPLFYVGGGFSSMREDVSVLLRTPIITCGMLSLNILATLVVKHSFVELLEEGQSLTATLAITVARMTGVVFSQVMATVFGNDGESASLYFWLGGALVASGSMSYANLGKLLFRR